VAIWAKNATEYRQLWGTIRDNPGHTCAELSRITNTRRSTTWRQIQCLDDINLLLYEDKQGRLYVIDRHLTVADLLVRGMDLPPYDGKAKLHDCPGAQCAITGKPIEHGYRAQEIVSSNTGEFLALLHGDVTGYVSQSAARAFKGSWNMGSRLIFEDGTMFHPLISGKDETRTTWSRLVRDVWPARAGERFVAIVATDYKKKVWPLARVGVLGDNAPVLLFDSGRNILATLWVNWPVLIAVLDNVEAVLALGFTKRAVAQNLLAEAKTAASVGLNRTLDAEYRLVGVRGMDEFKIAIVIAQKGI
jgi:hypothetical protein